MKTSKLVLSLPIFLIFSCSQVNAQRERPDPPSRDREQRVSPTQPPPQPAPQPPPATTIPRKSSNSRSVEILMAALSCDNTTEAGADEVYILVVGRRSDGATYAARVPGDAPHLAAGHWDMNDGGQPTDNPSGDSRKITSKSLFQGELAPGQSWNVVFMIMEEDGGTTKKAQEVAAGVLAKSENPFGLAAGALLSILTEIGFFINDTDDYIGSFGVHITSDAGIRWRAIDRVASELSNINNLGDREHEFRMHGDGSNYVGWYRFLSSQ